MELFLWGSWPSGFEDLKELEEQGCGKDLPAQGLLPSTRLQHPKQGPAEEPRDWRLFLAAHHHPSSFSHDHNSAKYGSSKFHTHRTHFLAKGCINNSLENILLEKHNHHKPVVWVFLLAPSTSFTSHAERRLSVIPLAYGCRVRLDI